MTHTLLRVNYPLSYRCAMSTIQQKELEAECGEKRLNIFMAYGQEDCPTIYKSKAACIPPSEELGIK